MKKLFFILSSVGAAVFVLAIGIAIAEENTTTTSIVSIPPITADVSNADLKQQLSIGEIQGRVICKQLGACRGLDDKTNTEILIKAAKITSIDSATLIKVSVFGYIYKINIPTNTKIVRHYWGQSDINEFSVGDIINVFGYLDVNDNYLVNAQTIRNVSIQKVTGVFKGTISSIDSANKTFVLAAEEGGDQTVKAADTTKIIKYGLGGCSITSTSSPTTCGFGLGSFSDLQTGTNVIVRGIWDKTLSTITANVINIGGTNDPRPFFKQITAAGKAAIKDLKEEAKQKSDEAKTDLKAKIEAIQKQIEALRTRLNANQ